jgi:hypothetical protein
VKRLYERERRYVGGLRHHSPASDTGYRSQRCSPTGTKSLDDERSKEEEDYDL